MVQKEVDIKPITTLKIGGTVAYLATAATRDDIPLVYKELSAKEVPVIVLGGGSNVVFPDGMLEAAILKIEIQGFEVIEETPEYITVKVGAGEEWDDIVERTVSMNLWGIEAMSKIPGTVGGTPIQNVGAYGQEIKDTLVEVEAYDIEKDIFTTLSNAECQFKYRDSIFKHSEGKKYIVTSMILRLNKNGGAIPQYPGVKKYFDEKGITEPTLQQIRQAIIDIRAHKLPDPKQIANVGSFFKNPIVENTIAEDLKNKYSDMPTFPGGEGKTKIPAGWLIETAGLKGKDFGTIKTYEHNALVLVNKGGATHGELLSAKDFIIETVREKFGITLEPEPIFIS